METETCSKIFNNEKMSATILRSIINLPLLTVLNQSQVKIILKILIFPMQNF